MNADFQPFNTQSNAHEDGMIHYETPHTNEDYGLEF